MAVLLTEDFNDQALDASLTVTSTALSHGFDSVEVLEGSHSYKVTTEANDAFELAVQGLAGRAAALDPVVFGCGLYVPSASVTRLSRLVVAANSSVQFGQRFAGANIKADGSIEMRAAGSLSAIPSGVLHGVTAAGVFTFDQWVFVECVVVFGNGTDGSFDVLLDGVSVLAGAGVDTITGGNAPETNSGGGVGVATLLTGTGTEDFWFDYFYVAEDQAATGGPGGGSGGGAAAVVTGGRRRRRVVVGALS